AWLDRARPAELVEAKPDNAAGGLKLAVDQEPHGECRRVPAARRETRTDGPSRGRVIEMERLRVVLGRKCLGARLLDAQPRRAIGLPDRGVLQVVRAHTRTA